MAKAGIQIFIREKETDQREEITDMYWFEENHVHDLQSRHVQGYREVVFEVLVDGKLVWNSDDVHEEK